MRLRHILSIIVACTIICDSSQACSSPGVPDKSEVARWVERTTKFATYVFLARITHVNRSGRIPALDTTVEVELLETLKGTPHFSQLGISDCQNFELKEDDVWIFFVNEKGMILPFTNYREFSSNDQLLALIHRETA